MATEKYTPNYETRDATLSPIVKFSFWLMVGVAIAFVSMYGMMQLTRKIPAIGEGEPHPLAALNDPIPPAPNLEMQRGVKQGWDGKLVDRSQRQPFTTRMWADVKVEAQQRIHGYGWIDRDAKVVHIPIERAMDLALQKGFPVQQKPKD
ncbi:MAG: hypothetical protein JNK02_07785 [Planctomycetes bacterium]|nr:hypothetical protein [Planctomycetota bacterium]